MTKKLKLNVETLEERIAPSLHGGCDTFGCDPGDPDPQPDEIFIVAEGRGGLNGATISHVPFGEDTPAPDVHVTHP